MSKIESVTIEGTLMPAAGVLKRGEQATVAYTDRIDRLVAGGHIKIVETFHADEEAPAELDQDPAKTAQLEGPEPPSRGAAGKAWQKWFDDNQIPYPEGTGRDGFLTLWDEHTAERTDGTPE